MNPSHATLLGLATDAVTALIAEHPELGPKLGPVSILLRIVGQHAGALTATQLEQIFSIQSLLRDARHALPDAPWAHLGELIDYRPTAPADFREDALKDKETALRQALVEVQARIEDTAFPQRTRLLSDIWTDLEGRVRRASQGLPQMW